MYSLPFLNVSADPNSIINYSPQPVYIRVTQNMTNSPRHYHTSPLAAYAGYRVTTHRRIMLSFPLNEELGNGRRLGVETNSLL